LTFNRKAILQAARLDVMTKYSEVALALGAVDGAQRALHDRSQAPQEQARNRNSGRGRGRGRRRREPRKKWENFNRPEKHGAAISVVVNNGLLEPLQLQSDPLTPPQNANASDRNGALQLPYLKYTKFVGGLFKRLQKYTERGIVVTNAPPALSEFAERFGGFTDGFPFADGGNWRHHIVGELSVPGTTPVEYKPSIWDVIE
jgi:hypothetical protein